MLPRIRWRGLRVRIVAWSFVPTMLIMIAVAVGIFHAYNNVTEDLVITRNREVVRLAAGQLRTAFLEYADLLDAEARTLALQESDPAVYQETLEAARNRLAIFDGGVLMLDTFGTAVAAEPERPDMIGQKLSDRSYYRQMVGLALGVQPEAVFSDVLPDGEGGAEVVAVAVPVSGLGGEFLGELVGFFRIGERTFSGFYGDVAKLRISESGNVYLVDGEGRVVYHTLTSLIASDFSSLPVVQEALSGAADAVVTDDSSGRQVVAGYAPIPGTPWALVVEEDWNTVISSGQGYRNVLLVLLALGVALPTLIVGVGVRRITRPIRELTRGAQRIADGDFDYTIKAETGDELQDLARQFNAMAGALKESYSDLERKVEERTQAERRRGDQLRTINEVGRSISSILSLDELLPFVVNSIRQTFGYYNVNVLLFDPTSSALTLKASAGGYSGEVPIGVSVPPGRGIVGWVAQSGESLLASDVTREPRYYALEELADTRSELAVPIRAGGEVLGVLDIESAETNALDEMDVFTAETLADQLAVAIRNARLYEQARELATFEERQRLARDLHDAVTQTLFSASIIAEVLPRLWEKNPADGKQRLEELRQLARGALAEMRMLLLELRPAALTEAALGELLRQLREALAARARMPVALNVEGERMLPPDVKVAFYRIAQETVNNIVKHSGAAQVSIDLRLRPEGAELLISDDGAGFDPDGVPPEHLGLRIMRERAEAVGARLEIESHVGQGTKVTLTWNDEGGRE